MSESSNYCTLCGQFVEVVSDREVWGISEPTSDQFELVCDFCVNEKLNFGKARKGGCLYCSDDADFELRSYGVNMTTTGPTFFAKRDNRMIVCREHFEELDESDQENIISIEGALSSGAQPQSPDVSIPDAIGKEEDEYLEYKETFQYDVRSGERNKSLKSKISKEAAAFGNSGGGVIIIGVRDGDKEVTGLERDYDSMSANWDEFSRRVHQTVSSDIGNVFTTSCVSIERHEINGSEICTIHVDPSPAPLFVDSDQFYVRQGSSSQPLTPEEAFEYISEHWET